MFLFFVFICVDVDECVCESSLIFYRNLIECACAVYSCVVCNMYTVIHTYVCVCVRVCEQPSERAKIKYQLINCILGENCLIFGNEILIFVGFHYTVDVNSLTLSLSVSFFISLSLSFSDAMHRNVSTFFAIHMVLFSFYPRFNIITQMTRFFLQE